MADTKVSIYKGSQKDPSRKDEGVGDLKVHLADYVDIEFQKLTSQNSSFTCFPSNLDQVFNVDNTGEKAELDVYRALQKVRIPGLEMTVFNGRCYAGKKQGQDFWVPREIDFAILLKYQGMFKVKLVEVKGSTVDKARKSINKTRGHALAQLRNHEEILGYKHDISKETFEKVHSSVIWPNLSRHFFCETCNTSDAHERFKLPPEE